METPSNTASNYDAKFIHWGKQDLGTLKMNPDMANMGIEDILDSAGLNFQVSLIQNYYKHPATGDILPSNSHSVIRADTGQELGFGMTARYQPMSYLDIMSGYFGDLKQLGGIPTRAISFGNGKKAAIQFVFGDDKYIGDRAHKSFFNFYSSHDGGMPILLNSSDTCIVCGNTFAMSKADKTLAHSVRHTINASRRLAELRDTIHRMEEYHDEFYNTLTEFLRYPASIELENQFKFAMFPDAPKDENQKRDNKARENQRIQLGDAIGTSLSERNTSDLTIYDFFAGITRFTSYKTQKRDESEQYEYVTEGPGAKLNSAGFNWLKEYIDSNSPKLVVAK